MKSHELAAKLLDGPNREVIVKVGEDSRDNPCYKIIGDLTNATADDVGQDVVQFFGCGKNAKFVELCVEE